MIETLVLETPETRGEIVPSLGGGIAAMDALVGGKPLPILRPWSRNLKDGPFALGLNVLVPFSNRISGGGFAFDGKFNPIAPNVPGEPCPIHGDGLFRQWSVKGSTATEAVLFLAADEIGTFRYEAEMAFSLSRNSLSIALRMTNRGRHRLPFGCGFHPWFPRTEKTLLQFTAGGVWHEDERHLPTQHVDIDSLPEWNFSRPRALPQTWINNAFTGWRGAAHIEQPVHDIAVTVSASRNLDTAIVYSPGAEADFFCFEPVSHAVDAHNQDGLPGLVVLNPGESLSAEMTIRWLRRGNM